MGYLYILKCCDGSYYTGSTKNLQQRLWQHRNDEGANFTKNRLPVELVYFEEYPRIDTAFYREKQVQNWSRKKKEALITGNFDKLPALAKKVFRKRASRYAVSPLLDTRPSAEQISDMCTTGDRVAAIQRIEGTGKEKRRK